ncbi:MAG: carbamoyltransferase HypF [Desulfatibacillaceae bacterium]
MATETHPTYIPLEARTIRVKGIVQGVGFRPFVYAAAREHGVVGDVANTSAGVVIHAEGTPEALDAFVRDVDQRHPPLAHVVEVFREPAEVRGVRDFVIIPSTAGERAGTLISPDVCTCDDCFAEVDDPADRRYCYPFTNCTNCGPRYTIIGKLPYDRPNTTMAGFTMCAPCREEYENPEDRRHHAQPNACPVCGPRVWLTDAGGLEIECGDPVASAAGLLRQGKIVAIKGLGGFHLCVNAMDNGAVARLRERKHREEKPLAVMAPDLAAARTLAEVSDEEERLLQCRERPVVLLKKHADDPLAPLVSPGQGYHGVMLPYTPLHHLLLKQGLFAIVATSGNLSEEPVCIGNDEAVDRLSGIADAFLLHDRPILHRCDDSVGRTVAGSTRLVRRSRGYVPVPVFLRRKGPSVLACGALLKNTVCLSREDQAFLSQHIGDLENLAAYDFLAEVVEHMCRVIEITPEIAAHDPHPDYLSTKYAMETGLPRVAVQHHHAHVVACMAENRITGPVIGLSADGTGLGADRTVWGGEVLIAEEHEYLRAGHFGTVPMPGGDVAVKNPWRMAVSYLVDAFGDDWRDRAPDFAARVGEEPARITEAMCRKGLNAPPTSSLGRLFDGVAAMVGQRLSVAYEGQAAMELEWLGLGVEGEPYEADWEEREGVLVCAPAPIVRQVVEDLGAGVAGPVVSARFHATVARLFLHACERIRTSHGLSRVVLSGGVFQNARLLSELSRLLEKGGFDAYTHRLVPTNDGGLALGQAVAAAAMAEKGLP